MNSGGRFSFDGRVVVILLIATIAALCFAPAASAQATVVIAGLVDRSTVKPGDKISLRYEVALTDNNSDQTTVSITNTKMSLSVRCPNGSFQAIMINPSARSFLVPANSNNNWLPSDSTYEGQTTAPATLCGGKPGVETAVIFTTLSKVTCRANSVQGCCHTVCFRMCHKHEGNGPTSFRNSCKPEKECISAQKVGCCKDHD
jgi:hypothetical protein